MRRAPGTLAPLQAAASLSCDCAVANAASLICASKSAFSGDGAAISTASALPAPTAAAGLLRARLLPPDSWFGFCLGKAATEVPIRTRPPRARA